MRQNWASRVVARNRQFVAVQGCTLIRFWICRSFYAIFKCSYLPKWTKVEWVWGAKLLSRPQSKPFFILKGEIWLASEMYPLGQADLTLCFRNRLIHWKSIRTCKNLPENAKKSGFGTSFTVPVCNSILEVKSPFFTTVGTMDLHPIYTPSLQALFSPP